MGDLIEAFIAATKEHERRLGRDTTPDVNGPLVLAEIATGAMFAPEPRAAAMSDDDFIEAIQSGEVNRLSDAKFRRWIDHLTQDLRMHEAFLVRGLIYHIEYQLETFAEDTSKRRRESQEHLEAERAALSDPAERERRAASINRILPPGPPRVKPDDLLDMTEQMFERWTPKATLDDLKQRRIELDTWREVTKPLLESME